MVKLNRIWIALWLVFSVAPQAAAQVLQENFWQTDGTVRAMVRDGGTLYIGGDFTGVGPHTGGGVVVDKADGAAVPGFPRVDGTIHAIVPDGSGGWYVGGSFTKIGGIFRNSLAQVDANLSVTSWNPNVNGTVYAVSRSGTTVYLGGTFNIVGGLSRANLAAVDANTSVTTAWNPGANNTVHALTVHTHQVSCPSGFCGVTQVYVGGDFTVVGGVARSRLAALDPATGATNSWNPNPNGAVWEIDAVGSTQLRVYVGGLFTTIGGQSRTMLASLTVTGTATTWNPNAGGPVTTISVQGGTVYVGGAFTQIGGQNRLRLAALDNTGAATSWNPSVTGDVTTLFVDGSTVYFGGTFTSVGGVPRRNAAAVDATTGVATSWNPSVDTTVQTLAANASAVYLGGAFTSVGMLDRNRIAAVDLSTGTATAWNPQANDTVSALALDGPNVYAGGEFTTIGGQARSRIAALDALTGLATAWNPSPDAPVEDILVAAGSVYAAGRFLQIGGTTRASVAALDPVTGAATAFDAQLSPPGSTVHDLLALDSQLYIAGEFSGIGPQGSPFLGSVDLATGAPSGWMPFPNGAVLTLDSDGSVLYAGGNFTAIGGTGRNHIAALDLGTALATAWNPVSEGPVHAIAANGTKVYAGGLFSSMGGISFVDNIAEISALTGAVSLTDVSSNLWFGATGPVEALLAAGPVVYAGGTFAKILLQPRRNLAALNVEFDALCGESTTTESWPACGTTVGATGTSFPGRVSATADGDGGAYVGWRDDSTDQVLINRVVADGTIAVGWPTGGVVVGATPSAGDVTIVSDGAGGAFATWIGSFPDRIEAVVQRLDGSGAVAAGWPVGGREVVGLTTDPNLGGPLGVASDGAGGLYVGLGERVQRIDAAGEVVLGWPLTGVAVPELERLIPDGSGGVFFVGGYFEPVTIGCIASDGSILWQSTDLVAGASASDVDMIPDGFGGSFVGAAVGTSVKLLRLANDGTLVPTWPSGGTVLTTSGWIKRLVLDDQGGVFVLWEDSSDTVGARLLRVTADGAVAADWPSSGLPIGPVGQLQHSTTMVSDGANGVYVSWLGRYEPGASEIFGTRICGFGTPAPGWSQDGNLLCAGLKYYLLGSNSGVNAHMLEDGAGGALLAAYRRTGGTQTWAGTIHLMRMGATPPSISGTMVAAGSNSQAAVEDVVVTFENVTTAGELHVARTTGPALPSGKQTVPAQAPAVYEISTSAVTSGAIEVCIDYDPAQVAGPEGALTLLHYEESGGTHGWVDITTNVNTTSHRICGTTTSLSPFAIVESVVTATDLPTPVLALAQNHPNPFNPRTSIRYQVPTRGPVELSIYDVRGRLVRKLIDGMHEPGSYEAVWTGADGSGQRVASGVYYYQLKTERETLVRRMALVR